jgi:hypothetical protein
MTLSELLVVVEADLLIGLGMRLLQEEGGHDHGMLALQHARALLGGVGVRKSTRVPRA